MVFQSYALYPHMTVGKNIAFPLKMAGEDKPTIDARSPKPPASSTSTNYLERRPGQLSGGQRQRVAIGRAIVRQPVAFLFDEPLSNLDAALRGTMRLEISELHQHLGTTMIYVTHDQVEAMTMADKIVVLNAGIIEQVGSPLELYRNPANLFVAGFIGSPEDELRRGRRGGEARRQDHRHPPRALRRLDHAVEGAWKGEVGVAEHLGADTFVHVHAGPLGTINVRAGGEVAGQPRRHRLPHPGSGQDPQLRRQRHWRSEPCVSRARSALITGARPRHRRGLRPGLSSPKAPRGDRRHRPLTAPKPTAAEIGPRGLCGHARRHRSGLDRRRGRDRGRGAPAGSTSWSTTPRSSTCSRSWRSAAPASTGCSGSTSAARSSPCRRPRRQMIAQGDGGKIINMASQAGRRGEPLVAVYCATKAAVISLTQSAGLALIPHRINVNAIAPGVVDGEHWDGVDALFAKYENRPPARSGAWSARRFLTAGWALPTI